MWSRQDGELNQWRDQELLEIRKKLADAYDNVVNNPFICLRVRPVFLRQKKISAHYFFSNRIGMKETDHVALLALLE